MVFPASERTPVFFFFRNWPRCDRCGERLSYRRIQKCRNVGTLTYPFQVTEGGRRELPVKWLCGSCTQRAKHHREKMLDEAASAAAASGSVAIAEADAEEDLAAAQ